jgi:hypothetical protein
MNDFPDTKIDSLDPKNREQITSATYQLIQPGLTLAAHLFVMACAHVL